MFIGLDPTKEYASANHGEPATGASGSVERKRLEAPSKVRAPITSNPATRTLPAPAKETPAGSTWVSGSELPKPGM